jgi:hypothetical protein
MQMTPTEADFAASEEALARGDAAYRDHGIATFDALWVLRDFYRREVAQAIAEARAQGRREEREACAQLVDKPILSICKKTGQEGDTVFRLIKNGRKLAEAIRARTDETP